MLYKGLQDEEGNLVPIQGAGTTYNEELNSLAIGRETSATGADQFVLGRFNEEDENAAEIVGGGTKTEVFEDGSVFLRIAPAPKAESGYLNEVMFLCKPSGAGQKTVRVDGYQRVLEEYVITSVIRNTFVNSSNAIVVNPDVVVGGKLYITLPPFSTGSSTFVLFYRSNGSYTKVYLHDYIYPDYGIVKKYRLVLTSLSTEDEIRCILVKRGDFSRYVITQVLSSPSTSSPIVEVGRDVYLSSNEIGSTARVEGVSVTGVNLTLGSIEDVTEGGNKNIRILDWQGNQWTAGDVTCDDGKGGVDSLRGKMDKVANATNGHVAVFDGNGGMLDGGYRINDIVFDRLNLVASAAIDIPVVMSSGQASLRNDEQSVSMYNGLLDACAAVPTSFVARIKLIDDATDDVHTVHCLGHGYPEADGRRSVEFYVGAHVIRIERENGVLSVRIINIESLFANA